MFENPIFLNLQIDPRDSYIRRWLSGLHGEEGKSLRAVAHLALLGVKFIGNGILGFLNKDGPEGSVFIWYTIVCKNMPVAGFFV